ncbi:hypothetical protein HQN59_16625 [Schlegelella sp. ID0723]|uniref:Uncharacterized protein n=1 Tax=Piscinibacter koreensis TaxID=2742824 RepID=A0A7Y6NQB0_9BURK|nr:hypothetical protein [Schlegelella koreensis]
MRSDADSAAEPLGADQRRRVRIFVALHLGALAMIYAIAWSVGGGFAGPSMPAPDALAAVAQKAEAPLIPVTQTPAPATSAPDPLPAWAERVETQAPWEQR